jgi:hypothetical protein
MRIKPSIDLRDLLSAAGCAHFIAAKTAIPVNNLDFRATITAYTGHVIIHGATLLFKLPQINNRLKTLKL